MSADHAVLDDVAEALGPRVTRRHPLGALTTYRVGGPATLFAEPEDEAALLTVAEVVAGRPVPVLILGRGSNLLVADAGFDGLVVSLQKGFDGLAVDGNRVKAGAGLSLPVLARRTAAAGLNGLEWAVGVPGSVGGAIRMNVGGHGSDTSATLVSLRWIDLATGTVGSAPAAKLEAAYRTTALTDTEVVVEGLHELTPGDPQQSAEAIADIVRWRREHQPGGTNAGSVFTNPPGDSAGRLIESSGLRGFRLGSAQVSTKHANFIQADAGGSADDVRRLIEHVRETVEAHVGVRLHTEVQLVGFSDQEAGPR